MAPASEASAGQPPQVGRLLAVWNTTLRLEPPGLTSTGMAAQYPLGHQEYLDLPALMHTIRREGLTGLHSVLDSANHCLALALVRQCSGRVLVEQVSTDSHQQAWHRLSAHWPVPIG